MAGYEMFARELQQLREMANWTAAETRRMSAGLAAVEQIRGENKILLQSFSDLSKVLQNLSVDRIGGGNGNPDVVRIEQIPGRRVAWDFLVEIPINANDRTTQPGTIAIDTMGPFVVCARAATFLSQFQFQRTDPVTGTVVPFFGRSNGRFRPIHSAWDVNDAILPADVTRVVAFPGTGAPSYSSPALHAPYRTMQGDFRIEMRQQSASLPRSNISVPSTFWTTQINSPFNLGCLDFFGRTEVIQFNVTPQHVNNPAFGNLFGFAGAGPGPFPFADAQFDHHEGIDDQLNVAVPAAGKDPVSRLPGGVLILLLHGYRILQPPGAVTNIGAI